MPEKLPKVRDTLKSKKRLYTPSESVASASSKRRRLTPVKFRRPTLEPISSDDDSESDRGQSEERQTQRGQDSDEDSEMKKRLILYQDQKKSSGGCQN